MMTTTTTTATTTRAAAITFALINGLSSYNVGASNPFNYTPSISLLDGSGEVNENGFCLRLISNHPLEEPTTAIDCDSSSTSAMDSVTVMGSSCLPSSGEGTQFGYNEDDQTIYAVNVICDEVEEDIIDVNEDNENDQDSEAIDTDINDLTIALTSKSGGNSHDGRRTCLTVEKPISEGSGLILTECYHNNNSTSAEDKMLMQQQTFVYTSSGKFRIDTGDDDGDSSTHLCLGMDDFIWQQGAPSPYVDPTFWRELTLMDCHINDIDSNNTTNNRHALITWLVNPTPTLNVVEDGPFPVTESSSLEDDEIFEDEIDADMDDDDELSMLGHSNNTTTDDAVTKPQNGSAAALTSVAKKSGSNLRS